MAKPFEPIRLMELVSKDENILLNYFGPIIITSYIEGKFSL
jgi:hypothetical protein